MTNEFTKIDRWVVTDYFNERFGVDPDFFDDYSFHRKGKRKAWIYIDNDPLTEYRYEALGLPILRTKTKHPKPTTNALQLLDDQIERNDPEIDKNHAKHFMEGENTEIELDAEQGYIAPRYKDNTLGCGLYLDDELRSMVPKGRRLSVNL